MSRYTGLFVTLLISMLITGCNTLSVDIEVGTDLTQNQPFNYLAIVDEGAEGTVSYEWSIDGKVVSSLQQDNALIANPGAHTLSIRITDEAGETGEAEVTLDVIESEILNPDFSASITTLDREGNPVSAVQVSIAGQTLVSDTDGFVKFNGLSQTATLVVSATKEGYLPQSYRLDFNGAEETATMSLYLLEQRTPIAFTNESETIVAIDELNTSVTLPANAFTDVDGNEVTGTIQVNITPIDTRTMGATYLGGGSALTDENEIVQLLSLGMIDFQFTQNGEPLQLAASANASIEMDLVSSTGPDGRVYVLGEEIEMWWFNDTAGLWVEEGTGIIIESGTSPTGMKLVATVEHFTTWNWDYYKAEDSASFTINCTREGQILEPTESCAVIISGSGIEKTYSVGAQGATAINVPPGIQFNVSGSMRGADGNLYMGNTSFTTVTEGSDVLVPLSYTTENTASFSCFINTNTGRKSTECFGGVLGSRGYIDRDFTYDSVTGKYTVSYVPGELLDIIISIQGQQVTDSILTPALGQGIAKEYTISATTGTLTCYATLDGESGEYYPCEAVTTLDTGKNFIVKYGDFSGSPLNAPITYNTQASTITVSVATPFNNSEVYHYLSSYEEYIDIWDSGSNDIFTFSSLEAVNVAISEDVNSYYLYDVECTYLGEKISPCYIGYRDDNSGTWLKRTNAPSWMSDKMYIPIEGELDPNDFRASPNEDIYNNAIRADSTEIDSTTRKITITLDDLGAPV